MEKDIKKDILKELSAPFPAEKIKWRVGATNKDKTRGIALAYIDARTVMDRLDEVLGIGGWQCSYEHIDSKTCVCNICILIKGEWIWRANGAGETDVEGEKGMLSDAFKRAAVLFGVGRYLYGFPNIWREIEPYGRSYKLKEEPEMPHWAVPKSEIDASLRGMIEALQRNDGLAVKEIYRELTRQEQMDLWKILNTHQKGEIRKMLQEK
jgi:hypothetical protein